ncbi:MAG TPA: DUF2064 domain-containing protein [Oscillatoriaceae cyanobacterium]
MRQGIVIFADSTLPALKPAVEAAIATGATSFVAYADPDASTSLRKQLGGPPPRFFPQAGRATLGERMAQAFAFLFVQDFEHVLLVTHATKDTTQTRLAELLAALEEQAVAIADLDGGFAVALRRADFPHVAAIFEEVAWERSGAAESANALLAEHKTKA